MEPKMTPTEALILLNDATKHVQANREVHVKLMEAIEVLSDFVKANTATTPYLEKSEE